MDLGWRCFGCCRYGDGSWIAVTPAQELNLNIHRSSVIEPIDCEEMKLCRYRDPFTAGLLCFNIRTVVRIPIVNSRQPHMHTRTAEAFFAVVFAGLLLTQSSEAGTVRVSFINDAASLEETIGILTNNGCGPEATAGFRRVVESYYAEGFQLDRSKFPELKGGFYSFSKMSDVVKALPHRLCDTEHSWGFNCFDTTILLADSKLQIGIRPDENFGPFMVSMSMTNGEEAITFAATARDAFCRINAQWYRDATDSIIPSSRQDDRIGLTAFVTHVHDQQDHGERRLGGLTFGLAASRCKVPRRISGLAISQSRFAGSDHLHSSHGIVASARAGLRLSGKGWRQRPIRPSRF
jgi:hypothetical protein